MAHVLSHTDGDPRWKELDEEFRRIRACNPEVANLAQEEADEAEREAALAEAEEETT